MKDIEDFSRKVKLRAHFDAGTPARNEFERKFYATNKLWEPSKTHHTVSTFLESFKQDATRALDSAKLKQTKNLTKKEECALTKLMKRTDVVICKADKGSATVMINVTDYVTEANRQLNDGS